MTPAEAEYIRLEATRELCRKSYYQFFKIFWEVCNKEPLTDNWHIKFLCDEAQEVLERIFKRKPSEYDLIINLPPGLSKSNIFSQSLNAWAWIRDPSIQILTGSHTSTLALRDAVKTRDIIRSPLYRELFPKVELRRDIDAKSWFANTLGGARYTCSVDGSPMGRHAHLIVIDDPVDPNKVSSEVERDSANSWFDHTLPTRKVDKKITATILIMQRLDQNDPTAHLLRKNKAGIRHICLPGSDSDNVKPPSCRKSYKDGCLDPVRLDKGIMAKLAMDLGQYNYASQIDQDPVARDGNLFVPEHIQKVKVPPFKINRIVRSWDKAGSEGKGCRTAGVKLGEMADGRYIVLHVLTGQWQAERREAIIRSTAEQDKTSVKIVIEQEPGSGGKESAEATVRNLKGFIVKCDLPKGDKSARAEPFATQVNVGNVCMLEGDWNESFVEELRMFPRGRFKDQVDAAAMGFAFLVGKKKIDYRDFVKPPDVKGSKDDRPRYIGSIRLPE